jgi:hypothetical protein
MSKTRVPVHGSLMKFVVVDPDATAGAVIGVNVRNQDGSIFVPALPAKPGETLDTTDDLDEGAYNLYFTDRRAQDAVGSILEDTSTIDLTYVGGTSIKANLVELVCTALTDLSYPNVVAVDGNNNAYYPDLTNPSDVSNIMGITANAAAAGSPVTVVTSRNFTETGWGWLPGRIFCGLSGGTLTQTAPSTGAIVEVARVISPTSIRVGMRATTLR